MERLNKHSLSIDDMHLLQNQVLPNWKRWMIDYSFGNPLFQHGLDGVLKWSAESDPDIKDRYQEYVRDQKKRAGE